MRSSRTRRVTAALAAAGAVVVLATGSALAVSAATSGKTAAPGSIYGCVSTSSRTLTHVYTSAANFRGCPRGSFAVTVASIPGKTGARGPQGPLGPTGSPGPQGPAGASAQALPYGIGQVLVDRGSGAAVWQTLSTTLGSPVADTTGGSFRFTCRATDCQLSVQAYTTASGYEAYPRLLIYKQASQGDLTEQYCEYADGVTNSSGFGAVGTSATALTLGVGGSFDCGDSSQTGKPADGVTEITVPANDYYDVQVTWMFAKVS